MGRSGASIPPRVGLDMEATGSSFALANLAGMRVGSSGGSHGRGAVQRSGAKEVSKAGQVRRN